MSPDPPAHQSATRYVREHDLGRTSLGDVGEVSKGDVRVEAFAVIEEANAAVGHALSMGGYDVDVARTLTSIQNDLFDMAADLSARKDEQLEPEPVRIADEHIAWVDRAYHHYREGLPLVEGFVMPGGTLAASVLFQARVAVRRAERVFVKALGEYPDDINPLTVQYLNSVSSLLFVLARRHNMEHGDMLWHPLASIRQPEGSPAAE